MLDRRSGILFVVWLPGVSARKSADQFIKAREDYPQKEVKSANSGLEVRSISTHHFEVRRSGYYDTQVLGTVSCPISGHFLQNCNILTQNSTNELKFSHNVASTSGK